MSPALRVADPTWSYCVLSDADRGVDGESESDEGDVEDGHCRAGSAKGLPKRRRSANSDDVRRAGSTTTRQCCSPLVRLVRLVRLLLLLLVAVVVLVVVLALAVVARRRWREARATPGGLTCVGSTTTSVTVRWNPVRDATRYDLQAATAAADDDARPFASVTTRIARATVRDLAPGERYRFKARAHDASAGNIIAGWSNFSAYLECATAAAAEEEEEEEEDGDDDWVPGRTAAARSPSTAGIPRTDKQSGTQHRPETIFLEMIRVSEHLLTTPDFLSEHNSADLAGGELVTLIPNDTIHHNRQLSFQSTCVDRRLLARLDRSTRPPSFLLVTRRFKVTRAAM